MGSICIILTGKEWTSWIYQPILSLWCLKYLLLWFFRNMFSFPCPTLLLEKVFEVLCVSFLLCPDSFQANYKFKSQINSMCFRTQDSNFLSMDIIPWYKLESYEKRRPHLKNDSLRLACGNICGVLSSSLIARMAPTHCTIPGQVSWALWRS